MHNITKQDALRWLDMQRDAINTEIAYAAPDDKGQYFGNLKVVNWIVDRVKDMTVVEFIEACEEICAGRRCKDCPINVSFCPAHCTRNAYKIVKRWKEEQNGNG